MDSSKVGLEGSLPMSNIWLFYVILIAVTIVGASLYFGRQLTILYVAAFVLFELALNLPVTRFLKAYYERNLIGYSLLFFTVRDEVRFCLFSNHEDPPVVVDCDDIAFTMPLNGFPARCYVLQRHGGGWRDLPWVAGASDMKDPIHPALTLSRIEEA